MAGYKLSYGTQTGVYTTTVDVGNVTSGPLTLPDGQRYYFAVRAYNTSAMNSPYSAEVFFDVPMTTTASIASLGPTSGPVGTSVTVSGANFGATKGTSTLTFNGSTATPTTWAASSIVVPIPVGATTGNVVVTVGGVASNGVAFTVGTPAPSITSLAPASGPVGTLVTINGTNFGASTGTSSVTFNGTTAMPGPWSATSIVVPVPAGATTGNVVVTVGGAASNGVGFTVPAAWDHWVQHGASCRGGDVLVACVQHRNGAGNFIAVVIRVGGDGLGLTVTDSRANTYRQAARFTIGTDHTGAIYYAENIGSGANTVKVSVVSAAHTVRFAILEYAGVAVSSALDRTVTAVGTSTSPSSGTLTTTTSGDLLLGAITIDENVNVVAGAGYTIRQSVPALPAATMIAEDRILATAGAVSATGTLGVAYPWGAALAAPHVWATGLPA